jgi:hypothetical protein
MGSHLTELMCDVHQRAGPDKTLLPGCVYVVEERPGEGGHPTLISVVHSTGGTARIMISTNRLAKLAASPSSELHGRFIASVLSYERMATTCGSRPSPPFLEKLLGSTSPKHVFFGDDGEELDGRASPSTDLTSTDRTLATPSTTSNDDEVAATLNPSQRNALQQSLSAATALGGFQIIVGPPGCGKTHFLVALLAKCLLRGVRVMVSAPSNKALCVALEKFLQSPTGQTHGHSCRLIGNRDALVTAATPRKSERDVSTFDVFVYGFFGTAAARLERLAAAYDSGGGTTRGSISEFDGLAQVLTKAAPSTLGSGSPSVSQSIAATRAQLRDVLRGAGAGGGGGSSPTAVQVVAPLVSALRELDDAGDASVHSELLSTAGAVFCTLCSSGQSVVRNMKRVDLLVVDESAQALEPEVLIALNTRPRALVLIGDPKQLPASITLPAAKHAGYGRSLMERMIDVCSAENHLLNTQ